MDEMRIPVEELERHSKNFGVVHFDLTDDRHGIVTSWDRSKASPCRVLSWFAAIRILRRMARSVVSHSGSVRPKSNMCLATQTIWQEKPKQMRINIEGELGYGVTAKDVILAVIGEIGTAGGTGYAIEYAGSAISTMSMEGRMTMSNMTIEAGARFGLMPIDEATIEYVKEGHMRRPARDGTWRWRHGAI